MQPSSSPCPSAAPRRSGSFSLRHPSVCLVSIWYQMDVARDFGLVRVTATPRRRYRRGIRCVQRLGAPLCQRKELWRKPYHPIGMGFLNLTDVAATNFIGVSMRRHVKNGPPLVFFGLLRGPLTLPLPPSLGLALLFGLLLTSGLLFCAGPGLLRGPPFCIAFRFLASRAKENSSCKEKLNPLHGQQAYYYCAS